MSDDDAKRVEETGTDGHDHTPPEVELVVVNETPWRLRLLEGVAGTHAIHIPALGRWTGKLTQSELDRIKPELELARSLGQISTIEEQLTTDRSERSAEAIGAALFVAVPLGFVATIVGGWMWIVAAVAVLVVGGLRWRQAGSEEGTWEFLGRMRNEFMQYWVLFLTGIVVAVSSFLALYHGTELWKVLDVRWDWPPVDLVDAGSGTARVIVVGYAVQLVFIVLAAFVPLYMFFQFDRERLSALRERWMHDVFRADPTIRCRADLIAKYGSHMEDAFGRGAGTHQRLRRVRRSPLVVAAVFLTVGWILVALRTAQPNVRFAEDGTVTGDAEFETFLVPTPSVLLFAFLGAYFFALHTIVRGYLRRDLQPKTYNIVSSRILVSVILAWALTAMFTADSKVLYAVAFFIGIVPTSFLRAIRELAMSRYRDFGGDKGIDEASPLTTLEGIDLYDRTRLGEEGINNIQALATHDLVDLMTTTRINAPRLVDWMDQSLLQLRLGGEVSAEEAAEDEKAGTTRSTRHDVLAQLRCSGIRTATDLLQVCTAVGRDPADQKQVLTVLAGGDADLTDRLQIMLSALLDEEWFRPIWAWRNSEFVEPEARRRYLDGRSWELHADRTPVAPTPPAVSIRPTGTAAAERDVAVDLAATEPIAGEPLDETEPLDEPIVETEPTAAVAWPADAG